MTQPEVISYPTLLDHAPPRIKAYPKESVVSEKLQTVVALGMANSRMKDYYDLWNMAKVFAFEGPLLVRAIKETFQRRNTDVPKDTPMGLSDEFAHDTIKTTQWKAFINKSGLQTGGDDLPKVVDELRAFLLPPLHSTTSEEDLQ